MTIRALIVDDEPLARRGLRVRLERMPAVEVIAECADGEEAVAAIRGLAPDLVFLDVQMPEMDGFAVVHEVGADRMPVTVFVTAFDQHAVRAFDIQALDYLLKPIDDERFELAVARARSRIEHQQAGEFGRRIASVLAEFGPGSAAARQNGTTAGMNPSGGSGSPYPDRFLVRTGGRIAVIPVDEIDWIEAAGNYVTLHVGKRAHLLRESMSAMEQKLDPTRFARIHRSTIVNVARMRALEPFFNREYIVILHDGTKLKLSRSYRDAFDANLGEPK